MLVPAITYLLFNSAASGAAGIYNQVGKIYGWQQMPEGSSGAFFGKPGCTRNVLEWTIELLRETSYRWLDKDRDSIAKVFADIANTVNTYTGADSSGITTFCYWVAAAAGKSSVIKEYLDGGDYTLLDDVKQNVSTTIQDAAKNIQETIEYGINYDTGTLSTIKSLIPFVGVLVAGLLVKKIFID